MLEGTPCLTAFRRNLGSESSVLVVTHHCGGKGNREMFSSSQVPL